MNTTLEHKSQAPNQRAQQHESQSGKAYPSRTIVHAKLEMTNPGDHDEQEADAVATNIMSGGKISRKISSGASGSSGIAVSQQMESQLNHLQGGGRQMPEGLRNMMESGFGQDFSQVRLHTDSEAASMSSSIHAKAFTHGNDIYFNSGQFAPETSEGQHLVAHELTHVVQGSGKVGRDEEGEDEKKKKIALVFYAGGKDFGMRENQAKAVTKQIQKKGGKYYHEGGKLNTKDVEVRPPIQFDSKQELIDAINRESNIIYLSIYSHGFIRGIISMSDYFEPQDVSKLNPESFNPQASIYLNGCHNGEKNIDNTIAQAMASHLKVNVFAFDDGVDYLKKDNGRTDYNGFMAVKGMGKKGISKTHKKFVPKNDFVDFKISNCKYENNKVTIILKIESTKSLLSSIIHLDNIELSFCDKNYSQWFSLNEISSINYSFNIIGLFNTSIFNDFGNIITLTFNTTEEYKKNRNIINEVQTQITISNANNEKMTLYNYNDKNDENIRF